MADGAFPDLLPGRYARTRFRMAAAAVAGAVAALGLTPFGLWPATLLAFVVLFLLLAGAQSAGRAAWTGWAAGTGYFAVALHWIVEPFLVDVARHGWMAPFAVVFLAGGLALFWAAAFALARGLGRTPFSLALAWAGTMTLAAVIRGTVLTGFPWALPGYVWVDTPALPLASYVGPYGLTLLTVALPALAGCALLRRSWPAAVPAVALAVGVAALLVIRPGAAATEAEPGPVIRLVQPNAAQRDKWDPEKVNEFFHRQLAYTADPAAPRPDLVVWPETAIPWDLTSNAIARTMIADAAAGVPTVVGFQRQEGARVFNSLAVLDETGEISALYDKHHLVPFGEYVPFGDVAASFGLSGFATRDGNGFSSGPGPRVLDLGRLGRALPLICYEAIFPQDVRNAPERPEWLLQITNDAWFGRIAGPQQHLAQARVRAAEQGLPLVRVANTGISAVIDADGQVTASLPLDTAGFVDAALPPARPATLYARTGDVPVVALALLSLGFAAARRFGKTD
jgi:apolipoprotein N-acyltransferase